MADVLNLYADESGSRMPDWGHGASSRPDWFGMGGVLVREREEDAERERHRAFVSGWPELAEVPLHSFEIRGKTAGFRWLRRDAGRRNAFIAALTSLICQSSLVCLATVIDRAGYRARYEKKYQPSERWLLCKTAFTILVERAAKYAQQKGYRLRVLVEKSDKGTDEQMRRYYQELKSSGPPFNPDTMASYEPLAATSLAATLYEFRLKDKKSPMMQLADLCLYPICRAGYQPSYAPFRDLLDSGRLIESHIPEGEILKRGTKYSCFPQQPTTIRTLTAGAS
jgi:hypothetical protein